MTTDFNPTYKSTSSSPPASIAATATKNTGGFFSFLMKIFSCFCCFFCSSDTGEKIDPARMTQPPASAQKLDRARENALPTSQNAERARNTATAEKTARNTSIHSSAPKQPRNVDTKAAATPQPTTTNKASTSSDGRHSAPAASVKTPPATSSDHSPATAPPSRKPPKDIDPRIKAMGDALHGINKTEGTASTSAKINPDPAVLQRWNERHPGAVFTVSHLMFPHGKDPEFHITYPAKTTMGSTTRAFTVTAKELYGEIGTQGSTTVDYGKNLRDQMRKMGMNVA